MSMKYEVWSIRNGKTDKMTYVTANSKQEAYMKAIQKFKDMKITFQDVKVK